MNEIEKILNEYYSNYNEEDRLIKDKAHSLEFITTTKYIEKYLKTGDRILEIGAGTGRYSIYYAEKGYQVDAVELVERNLQILRNKITENMTIQAVRGNALDLGMYEENTFDITLVLGPLYHLYDESAIQQAISEAVRVTKKGGKIFLAYITDDAVVLSYGVRKGNLRKLQNMCDENWKVPKRKEEVFASFRVDEFSDLISNFAVQKLETIATDGIAPNMPDYINHLPDEEFELYVDYHLKSCMRQELLGLSSHVLEIVKK